LNLRTNQPSSLDEAPLEREADALRQLLAHLGLECDHPRLVALRLRLEHGDLHVLGDRLPLQDGERPRLALGDHVDGNELLLLGAQLRLEGDDLLSKLDRIAVVLAASAINESMNRMNE